MPRQLTSKYLKRSMPVACLLMIAFFVSSANAVITVSLDPSTPKIHSGKNLFVDINVSGLQWGGVNTLIGAFDLDVNYESTLFTPLLVPPVGFGTALGDIFLGEAVGGVDTTTPGVINLFEVYLLTSLELAALQSDSFTLATLGFFASGPASGSTTTLSTSNIVLSDDLGNLLSPIANPSVIVNVPEPITLSLIAFGLAGISYRRSRIKPA